MSTGDSSVTVAAVLVPVPCLAALALPLATRKKGWGRGGKIISMDHPVLLYHRNKHVGQIWTGTHSSSL